jgi:hypothetical protein
MVERPLRMREAGGSMPPSSKLRTTLQSFFFLLFWAFGQSCALVFARVSFHRDTALFFICHVGRVLSLGIFF